jgi:acetoacetyl-CoA synthetase
MEKKRLAEGTLLWEPSLEFMENSNIRHYMRWLETSRDLSFKSYDELWTWSVTDTEGFWGSLWDYFRIKASKPYARVLEGDMPGAKWFGGAELNYAEHVFRNSSTDYPALIFQSEIRPLTEVSWEDLYRRVSSVAAALRKLGIKPGDRVVAYMPNIPETLTAFLAVASIGAVWSSCSPDFGTRSVIDRFKQIEPKVLFAVDGYQYGGKRFERLPEVSEIQQALGTLQQTVLVPYLQEDIRPQRLKNVSLWEDILKEEGPLLFQQVPFDHPLWVVYSSGTTGLPKALVHGQGGVILELMKFIGIHLDIKPADRFFWFSTTGWVMWNIVQGGLLLGATPILYDGSPGYPNMDILWELAEKTSMKTLGSSAAFLSACMNEKMEPGKSHDLSALKSVGSTGSPLSPDAFEWVYKCVKRDIWLCSVSGGTDPCTGFLVSCPLLPVHAGELQCRGLGVKAEAFDESGHSLIDQVGELVITKPMPSMPLFLWNDQENKRYYESYFAMYPGVWRHGDWIKITPRGSAVILGRSDSTLNRMGVRMGSSEIYSAVEEIPEVVDSLVLGIESKTGGYYMPLFVVLKEDARLDEALKKTIKAKIRTTLSPRHVPDDIFAIPEVPRTLNYKKLEVPVKKLLMGIPLEKAVNVDSMGNPHSISYFVEFAKKFEFSKG